MDRVYIKIDSYWHDLCGKWFGPYESEENAMSAMKQFGPVLYDSFGHEAEYQIVIFSDSTEVVIRKKV